MLLARKAVLGALWTISSSLAARAVGVAGTVWLTHLLAPDVYGEVTIAVITVLTAHTLFASGLVQYVFARPETGRAGAFHVTLCYLGLGAVGLGGVVVLRGPLGPLFHAPGMSRFVPGLALAVFLDRVATMPERIQTRDMRFKSLAVLRSAGELTYSVLSVSLALAGWGGDAIVAANLGRSLLKAVFLLGTTDRRDWLEPCRLQPALARDVLAFGVPMTVVTVTATGSKRWDNLVFSYLFGVGAQGIYNQAYNLADLPAAQIGETVGDVLAPSFVRLDRAARPAAVVRAMTLLMLIVAPLSVGLAVVAQDVTDAFLGERWRGVGPMLAVLAALSVTRPVSWTVASYLQVMNQPRLMMWIEGRKLVLLLASIAMLGYLGRRAFGEGAGQLLACGAVGLVYGLNALRYLRAMRTLDGLALRPVLRALGAPLAACVPMAACVMLVRAAVRVAVEVGPGAMVVLEVGVGALAFVPSALWLAPATSRDLLGLLRTALRRPAAASA